MSVELAEIATSDLVTELKYRCNTSVILLAVVGEGGALSYQYYRGGEIVLQLGLVQAMRGQIERELIFDDLEDED